MAQEAHLALAPLFGQATEIQGWSMRRFHSGAAVVDDVGVGRRTRVVLDNQLSRKKLPDVLDRVQLGRSGWQQHQREVVWHDELLGAVPSGPVHQHDPMGSGSHGLPTSARCRLMACVSHRGSTKAAPLPCCGQIAPKM